MENSNENTSDSSYISNERDKLFSKIRNVDEELEDFKEMLQKSMNHNANYSLSGLKYVELLLMQIQPDVEEDADLLVDSALYIGETVRRIFNAAWNISDDKDNFPENYGQPVIIGNDNHLPFYPFVEIKNFCQILCQVTFKK